MSKKPELVALSAGVALFTSLFVNVPLRIKVNPLESAVNSLHSNIMFETSSINEVLFVKLLLTYLLFAKSNINCNEFLMYIFALEALTLVVVRKSSFILHTGLCFVFFKFLNRFYPEQRNLKNKTLLI